MARARKGRTMPTLQAAAALTVASSPSGCARHCCAMGAIRNGHDSLHPAHSASFINTCTPENKHCNVLTQEPALGMIARALHRAPVCLTSTENCALGCTAMCIISNGHDSLRPAYTRVQQYVPAV